MLIIHSLIKIGLTDDMRATYRQRLLNVTKDVRNLQCRPLIKLLTFKLLLKIQDVVDVANRYLLENVKEGKSSQVVFGTQSTDLDGLMKRGNKSLK